MNDNAMPLYQNVKDYLLDQIHNELSVGDRLPTEIDLVEKFAVSRITVSKALNELRYEGLIARYPGRGSYVISKGKNEDIVTADETAGREALASANTGNVMCILPSIADKFALNVVNGIKSALPADQYNLYFVPSGSSENEELLLKGCLEGGYDGVVIFPVDQKYYSNMILRMKLENYPAVFIDRALPGIDMDCVLIDNLSAGNSIFEYLYSLGHTNFLFVTITSREVVTVKKRIKGMKRGMERLDIPISYLHIIDDFDITKESSSYIDEFRSLIDNEHITAVVCSEANTCLYVHSLLMQMGKAVPEDISIVSFDNPTNDNPKFDFFTHIDQNEYQMGKTAGQILLEKLNGKDKGKTRHIMKHPTLEIRSSTAPAASVGDKDC